MKPLLQSCVYAFALLYTFGIQGFAGIIQQGSFEESLDLPYFMKGPRTFSNVGLGLTFSDEVDNPGYSGYLEVDLTGNILTLTHFEFGTDYQIASVDISNIVFDTFGQYISDVQLVGSSIIDSNVNPLYSSTETIDFTGSSIKVSWSVTDPYNSPETFSFVSGGTATYEITLSSTSTVPEPGTLAIFGLATIAGGMCPLRRRLTQRA